MSDIKEQLARAIAKAATKVIYEDSGIVKKFGGVVSRVDSRYVELESIKDEQFGDYTSNFAMMKYREFAEATRSHVPDEKKQGIIWMEVASSPSELAKKIRDELISNSDLDRIVGRIEVAGPGFINFWLKRDALLDTLKQIDTSKDDFGKTSLGKDKTVIIDYSSPNIAKPFGIGHLRSTIIGQALCNLYKFLGYEVVGDNHLGDWGTQFGKLICMIEIEGTKDLSIENLERLYVEFHRKAEEDPSLEEKARECFKKLEEGDPETKKIWEKAVEVSMAEFGKVYEMLGVKPDFSFGESYYESEMRQMVSDPGTRRHLTVGEEGAMVIDLSHCGIETPLMFLKKDGATTYATRDLATIGFRVRKWNPDIIIYEVGAEQTLHFRQVFAAARLLGLVEKEVELVHTAHGLYLAPDGKKFSTRKGKTVKLEDVLNEAISRAEKLGEGDSTEALAVARQVGIGAIKYFDLMHSVKSDVVFDWDKIMNLEGNSGPYLQYTHARCMSVLNKSNRSENQFVNKIENVTKKLESEEELVLRSLIHFPEIVEESAKNFAPNLLCNYLYDLAGKYNHLYNSLKIIGSEAEDFRLALTSGVGRVLKNGLGILGIETPERM